jgi:hypothetical protein
MDVKSLSRLSDERLLRATAALVRRGHAHTANLVAHLAEVHRRRAYRPAGYGSMYQYCLHQLHLSEHSAYRYIWAVRLARRFPVVLGAIADGLVHLAGLRELGPYMTPENAAELLAAATHRTRAEIMLMLASRFPRPDIPTLLRPLAPSAAPEPLPVAGPECSPAILTVAPSSVALDPELAPGRVATSALDEFPGPTGPLPAPVEAAPSRITPSSPGRFAVQVTLDQHTHDLLRRAQELLAHAQPGWDVSRVLERALLELVQRLEHRKHGATEAPRPRRASLDTRYVPAEIKRQVAERDGYRCAFVSDDRKRCTERSGLEYDHIQPLARGGRTTVDNLRLLCPEHNQYAAERVPVHESPRSVSARASCRPDRTLGETRSRGPGPGPRQACMRCCEVPWPRMALMRSTSLRGLNGLVM